MPATGSAIRGNRAAPCSDLPPRSHRPVCPDRLHSKGRGRRELLPQGHDQAHCPLPCPQAAAWTLPNPAAKKAASSHPHLEASPAAGCQVCWRRTVPASATSLEHGNFRLRSSRCRCSGLPTGCSGLAQREGASQCPWANRRASCQLHRAVREPLWAAPSVRAARWLRPPHPGPGERPEMIQETCQEMPAPLRAARVGKEATGGRPGTEPCCHLEICAHPAGPKLQSGEEKRLLVQR